MPSAETRGGLWQNVVACRPFYYQRTPHDILIPYIHLKTAKGEIT
jgi:hypothetical protein